MLPSTIEVASERRTLRRRELVKKGPHTCPFRASVAQPFFCVRSQAQASFAHCSEHFYLRLSCSAIEVSVRMDFLLLELSFWPSDATH